MPKMVSIWRQFFIEPLRWVFYCFFQPLRFRQRIEGQTRKTRFNQICKLALPLFICTYPVALVTRLVLVISLPTVYGTYYSHDALFSGSHVSQFLFDATWPPVLAIGAAIVAGTIFRLSYGIALGIAAGFWGGVAARSILGSDGYLVVAVTVVVVLGLVVGVAIGSARDIANRSGFGTGVGSFVGLVLGIAGGFLVGIAGAYIVGIYIMQLFPVDRLQRAVLASTISTVLSGGIGALVAGVVVGIIRGALRERALQMSIDRALSVGTATCIAASAAIGGVMGTAYGGDGQVGLALGMSRYILPNLPVAPIFILCYILGYYRLPLYVFSGTSSLIALLASRKVPTSAFKYVQHSALYWDEGVFLPLLGLREMLSYMVKKDIGEALQVITFIIAQRPSQFGGARPVIREMTVSDLEARSTIELIARAFEDLAKMIPRETMLVDPHWQLSLIRFEDASREASRYCTPLGRIARHDALELMLYNLNRVHIEALGDLKLEARLRDVANKWLEVVQDELRKLKISPEKIGMIDNPYICGPALRENTRQFVGRRDLVQQIERALGKGVYRPCFFLTGERRMGKTSTLNQLPRMLGSRYLPVTFDLQLRGISSNAAAFLAEIAEAVHTVMISRGIRVNKLEYAAMNEVRRENEAAVYRYFDIWLRQVEAKLEEEQRTILIAFDEFEKLEDAGRQGYLNLSLLLDWFRSVIQNRSRLAFLFSGVKTVGEMAGNWSGYFVNVQTLKVTFLAPADAFRLITQPANDYPSEQIFGDGVVEEIMRVTGNHPFLLQALCYEVIEILNGEQRGTAEVADVQQAIEQVFEHWQDTYFMDLWKRTSANQRLCLQSLHMLHKASLQSVVEQSGLDERTVHEALQVLRRRDLVLFVDNCYQIAAPIFSQWVIHYNQLLSTSSL